MPRPSDGRSVVGVSSSDDAAAYCLGDPSDPSAETVLSTIDFFTPIVESPFDFGRVAAANSLSDIYAMGGEPLFALNIVGFPVKDLPLEVLTEIVSGGSETARRAGIPVLGGHSVDFDVPVFGMAVTGRARLGDIWRNVGVRAGDALVLTKPLGSGVVASALRARALGGFFRRGPEISAEEERTAVEVMASLNDAPARLARGLRVSACTDVTGYGLAGHLREMLLGPPARCAELWLDAIPYLPGAERLAEAGIAPDGSVRNLETQRPFLEAPSSVAESTLLLLCDAQTSGGLLLALEEKDASDFVKRAEAEGVMARIIGRVLEEETRQARIRIRP
ncbi:MAG: selenide, water dikinase SelD [Thermoanaerobaculia bacterium]|nr:selenide, water dikinase SelD [Thermoanaerobaculia bacterium]